MVATTHCPVCGKAGIPDYRTAEVQCPQCASDLQPYFLLHQLRDKNDAPKTRRKGISPIATGVIGIAIGALALTLFMSQRDIKGQVIAANTVPVNAPDSSKWYRQQIAALQDKLGKPSGHSVWRYTVRAGDNLWSIANRFYGNGRAHDRIRADNGLSANYVLQPGQVLTLNPL